MDKKQAYDYGYELGRMYRQKIIDILKRYWLSVFIFGILLVCFLLYLTGLWE